MPLRKPTQPPAAAAAAAAATQNWHHLLTKPHLSTLTSSSKRALLATLASEITFLFIRVSELTNSNDLGPQHTGPIEDVIGLITGVEKEHRRGLERRVRRAERRERRRVKRWREERRWMRKSYAGLLRKAMEVSARWRERVRFLEEGRETILR